MKIFIVSLLLFAIICGGVIFNSLFLDANFLNLRDALVSIPIPQESAKDLTFQLAAVLPIQRRWYDLIPFFSLTISHQDLMEVETQFAATIGAAGANSRDTYLVSLAQLEYTLTHLAEMSRISLQNVL